MANNLNDPDFAQQCKPTRRCPHCKAEIELGHEVCPECRHYTGEGKVEYMPMNKKTAKTVRWVIGAALIIVFAILVWTDVIPITSCNS